MSFNLETKRLHEQQVHAPNVIAGAIQIGLDLGVAKECASIGGLGELIEVDCDTGRIEARQHFRHKLLIDVSRFASIAIGLSIVGEDLRLDVGRQWHATGLLFQIHPLFKV